MSDDQFMKLFKYIEDFRQEVNDKFDETAQKSSLDQLTNTIDKFLKRLDDMEIEDGARDMQFNRLLSWAKEVSAKTGIPLHDL